NLIALDLDFGIASSYNIQISTVTPYAAVTSTGFIPLGSGIQHIDFASPIVVIPETQYEIRVFDTTPGISGDYYVLGAAGTNPYSRGTARFPGGGNDTFGHDWYFVTYTSDPVPEPASLLSLASGLIGCGLLARRRRS